MLTKFARAAKPAAASAAADFAFGVAGEHVNHVTGRNTQFGSPSIASSAGAMCHKVITHALEASNSKAPRNTMDGKALALQTLTGISSHEARNALARRPLAPQTFRSFQGAQVISPQQSADAQAGLPVVEMDESYGHAVASLNEDHFDTPRVSMDPTYSQAIESMNPNHFG